jgi:hypothetical protein
MNFSKKILFLLLFVAFFAVGCSSPTKQTCYQREVKYTEGTAPGTCTEKTIVYEISNIEKSIQARPTQADHQYDSGEVNFNIINKDKKATGYFNISMECIMPKGNTVEKTTVFLATGEVKKVNIKCSTRGMITDIKDLVVDSAPMTQNCPAPGSAPVEKVRYETVCE